VQPDSRIFISHASQDRASAIELVASLEARGLLCWLASRDIPVGANYAEEIFTNIRSCSAMVILLSRHSLDSKHVRRELNMAIDVEKVVLPLSLEPGILGAADLPADWAYWLSLIQIHAFTSAELAATIVAMRMPNAVVQPEKPASPVAAPVAAPTPAPATAEPASAAPQVAPAPAPAPAARTASVAPRAAKRGAPTLDDRVRSALIQVGAAKLTFEIAVERGRRLGATAEDVSDVAYRLRDGNLLAFEGDLTPQTVIRLT